MRSDMEENLRVGDLSTFWQEISNGNCSILSLDNQNPEAFEIERGTVFPFHKK